MWKWWIGLALIGLFVYFVGPEEWGRYIYSSYALAAACVALISILRLRPRRQANWYWLVAWLAAWGLADGAYNFAASSDWLPQPLYVLGYGFASVFAVNMYRHAQSRGLTPITDSATIVLAIGLVVWNTAFYPRLGEESLRDVLTMFIYPALDIFLFGLFLANAIHARKRPASLWLTVAGSALLVAVDVPFSWMGLSETYVTGPPIDALWLGTYVLLGAAVLHPSAGATLQIRQRSRATSGWAFGLVAIAMVVPALTLVISHPVDLPTTIVIAVIISALVMWRLLRTAGEKEEALQETEDALEELALKERSFRLLAENAQDVIFRYRFHPQGGFDYVSPASTHIIGYTPEDWYGDPELWKRISDGHFADHIASAELPDGPFILPWRHKDNHIVWIELLLTPIVEGDRLVAVEGRGRDVTQQVEASEKLETLRVQSEAILNSVGQGIIYTDSSNLITFVNPAAADMVGWEVKDLLGRDGHETLHHSRRDGTPYPRQECPIWRSSKEGVTVRSEDEHFWRKDGSWLPIDLVVTPPVGGPTSGAVVVFSDTSERRELEQRIRQTEKMEAFGQIAGGVAHDFNNLLSVVINYGAFLLEDMGSSDPRAEDLREIVAAGERGARLTRQLLTFSRRDDARPVNISANEIITDITKMLRRTIKESVCVELDLDDELWDTYIDAGQLEQVILNLAVNAGDAMPEGGELRIRTRNLPSSSGRDIPDSIAIDVSDNGTGMPDEIKEHVFEPFFTTKGVDQGTGLGLATVYGIVEGAGGAISCGSEVGRGTTFEVLLPRSSRSAVVAEDATSKALGGRKGTILVVEDEVAVLGIATKLLLRNGYSPIAFKDPREALDFSNTEDHDIALLLTDIVMPGMSGTELASSTGLPVVYMTGYPDRSLSDTGYPSDSVVLHKPFSEQELLQAIDSLLGAEKLMEVAGEKHKSSRPKTSRGRRRTTRSPCPKSRSRSPRIRMRRSRQLR